MEYDKLIWLNGNLKVPSIVLYDNENEYLITDAIEQIISNKSAKSKKKAYNQQLM